MRVRPEVEHDRATNLPNPLSAGRCIRRVSKERSCAVYIHHVASYSLSRPQVSNIRADVISIGMTCYTFRFGAGGGESAATKATLSIKS
jgi:hypothetical protein